MSARALSRFQFWDHVAISVAGCLPPDASGNAGAEFAAHCADVLLKERDARYEFLKLSKPVPPKSGDPDGEGPDEIS